MAGKPKQKLLTDSRLPGKKYKTERGLNQALAALEKRERGQTSEEAPVEVNLKLSAAAEHFLAHDSEANVQSVTSVEEAIARTGAEAEPEQLFVRNNYHTDFSLRLDRHEGKRRIELKPRGQRGDFSPIQKADLSDPALIANVNIGVIEVITAGEAAEVATKQTTNQQKVHPALAVLRNELGEEYAQDAVKTEIPFEQQGVVVAELEDGNVVMERGGIRRKRGPGEGPGTPDYVAGAETQHAPAGEEPAFLSDLAARRKDLEGPAAGLGGIQRVTVAEPQKAE